MYYPFSETSTPFLHLFYDFFITLVKPAGNKVFAALVSVEKSSFPVIFHPFSAKSFLSFFSAPKCFENKPAKNGVDEGIHNETFPPLQAPNDYIFIKEIQNRHF